MSPVHPTAAIPRTHEHAHHPAPDSAKGSRVVVLRNPRSGREHALRKTGTMIEEVRRAGHHVELIDLTPGLDPGALERALDTAAALVLVGGDGTVHHALELATRRAVPIYHVPMGNENLFAREFGMTASSQPLLARLQARTARSIDLGAATLGNCVEGSPVQSRLFALMLSVGFDAGVVERVCAARRGGVTRSTYVAHGLREFLHPRWTPLTVVADGRSIVTSRPGLLIVANSRHYAAGLNPAHSARVDDGLLDVVFMPMASRRRLVYWLASMLLRNFGRRDGLIETRARRVEVRTCGQTEAPVQIDGEAAGRLSRIEIDVRSGALRVLSD